MYESTDVESQGKHVATYMTKVNKFPNSDN